MSPVSLGKEYEYNNSNSLSTRLLKLPPPPKHTHKGKCTMKAADKRVSGFLPTLEAPTILIGNSTEESAEGKRKGGGELTLSYQRQLNAQILKHRLNLSRS